MVNATGSSMSAVGNSKPDCLIAAGMARHMEVVLREMGHASCADRFKGYDRETEEDAFMDGDNAGNPEVTYDRPRAGQPPVLDQQCPRQHLPAEPVPGSGQRLRSGPLPRSVHRDETRGHGRAWHLRRRSHRDDKRNRATQGMVYPTDTTRRNHVAMVFGSPAGSQGNVINPGVNQLVLPNCKHTWGGNATPSSLY